MDAQPAEFNPRPSHNYGREREIRAFIPEKYWTITADVSAKRRRRREIYACVLGRTAQRKRGGKNSWEIGSRETWKVKDVAETEAKEVASRAISITSTLQQSASSRLGFAPSRTMGIATKTL